MEWVIALVLGALGLTLVLAGVNGSAGNLIGTITGAGGGSGGSGTGGQATPPPTHAGNHGRSANPGDGYPQASAFAGTIAGGVA